MPKICVWIFIIIILFQDVIEGDLFNRAIDLKNDSNNLLEDAKTATKDLEGMCEFNKNLTL